MEGQALTTTTTATSSQWYGGPLHQWLQHGPFGIGQRRGVRLGRGGGSGGRGREGVQPHGASWSGARVWTPVPVPGASSSYHLHPKPAGQPDQPKPVLKHSLRSGEPTSGDRSIDEHRGPTPE